VHRVPTDDGAAIALGRYLPRGPRRFKEPVVLCHGLGANRFNLDFDERYSVARYLARRGFETWVLELRGRGLAGPANVISFDAQAEYDVRAALRTVRAAGADQVTWVGHSKGGMLMYAHLARNPQAPVRALVGLGTPATFTAQPGLGKFIETVSPLLELKSVPMQKVLGSLAWWGPPPGPITRYLAHTANVDPEVLKRAMANCASDLPGGVARQFAGWIQSGRFDALDGFDYRAHMGNVRIPLLLVGGSRDLMAPPAAVRAAQAHVAGPVTWRELGRAHGFREDYGHGDLVLGRHAPDEVFPVIAEFLEAHSDPE